MDSGQVLEGLGLGAYGVAFYAFVTWYVRDEARLRRMAQSRWRFDRRFERRLRTGQMTREEWFDRWCRSQRLLVKWIVTPFIVLWLGLAALTAVRGLLAG
jgi:hypothetical protein